MDINKPLRRRMKIKQEGGEGSWVIFKYERFSTFCFVCGMLGHLERYYGIVYAHPDKKIARAYGVWLRAPTRNIRNQNLGSQWLRNGGEASQAWEANMVESSQSAIVHGHDKAEARFMEVDGTITKVSGDHGGIRIVQRNQRDMTVEREAAIQLERITGENNIQNETDVLDPKRKRVDMENIMDENGEELLNGPIINSGPKNLREAGPVLQARLDQ